jgi:glycosyltransferase involved in cell wall biosynthesis
MKVLHFTRHFFPEYSGTSTRLYNLICRLPSEVCVVTSNRKINGEVISQPGDRYENISVKRVPLYGAEAPAGIPALRYARTIYSYYRMSPDVQRVIGDEKWDIFQAHNVLPFAGAARQIAERRQIPLVFELHGIAEESLKGIARLAGDMFLRKETQQLMRRSARTITLTQSLKESICSRYKIPPEKITVVPNGADTEQFSPKEEYKQKAGALREKFNIRGKVVIYAGVMDRINGLADLADIMPQIIAERPSISFVFIGNGPESPRLGSLFHSYPENVRYLGQVPYAEMPLYYQMCDVFIIPRPSTLSSETLTPLKLLEAMASTCVVLGSDVGGITEVVKHGANGYLFRKGNPTSLKKTLFEALDADSKEIARNARDTIVKNYTWEKSSCVLWQVYEDVV